jgi:hypothetical protein
MSHGSGGAADANAQSWRRHQAIVATARDASTGILSAPYSKRADVNWRAIG